MNRTVDDLGRIVIPKEIRDILKITIKTLIKIEYNNEKVILTPIKDKISCNFCGAIIDKEDKYCYNCGSSISELEKIM